VYFRGKPFNPKKCRGIKVKFTPKNIKVKTETERTLSKTTLVIRVNQKTTPVKIPNTAPNLKT
jgi:hypothetical protein